MRRPRTFRPSGSVLVVVLWMSVSLVSVALLFGHSMLMTYRGGDNDLSGRQADMAIDGAVRYARSLLVGATDPGIFPDPDSYESEAVSVGAGTFWFLGRSEDESNTTTRTFALVDEASKLNINTATAAMLMQLESQGMTQELADEIVWQRTPANAGTSSPAGAQTKGAPFESLEELAMNPLATELILHGEDTNENGFLDTNENDGERSLPPDNTDGKLDAGIFNYLTVFTSEPAMLSDGVTPRIALPTLTTPAAMAAVITMLSDAYSDRASDFQQKLQPDNTGKGFESVIDFFLRSGISNILSDEEFDKIAVNLMVPDAQTPPQPIVGVNVNTASATVLACVIPPAAVDELIAARANGYISGIVWAARLPTMANLGPAGAFLTGNSYQVSADVAAVGRNGRGYRRTRFVIDMNPETNPNAANVTSEPRIIYRRNLASLGWALGSEVRQQIALKKEAR